MKPWEALTGRKSPSFRAWLVCSPPKSVYTAGNEDTPLSDLNARKDRGESGGREILRAAANV